MSMSEHDYLLAIRAGQSLQAHNEILDALVGLAGIYIARGHTQEGADVLAYVLGRPVVPLDIVDDAQALWDDLARWICPRVLLDAQDFAQKATLQDVIEYAFAGT